MKSNLLLKRYDEDEDDDDDGHKGLARCHGFAGQHPRHWKLMKI